MTKAKPDKKVSEKAKKAEKKVEVKSEVKTTKAKPHVTDVAPTKQPVIEVQWSPEVGSMCLFTSVTGTETIGEIKSLEPLMITEHVQEGGVVVHREVTLHGAFQIRPISRQEYIIKTNE